MKLLLNKTLIGLSCTVFGLYFGLTMLILAICYFFKALYFKALKKGEFHINPLKHVNPEVLEPTMTVMSLDGFRIDTYDFLTDDNCTLTVWRVVNLNSQISKPYPIFLQHGLLDCSVSWFLQQDKNKALPYVLSTIGFDVWIGNNRGTKYSSQEKGRPGYWDYTFDELVKYDVPAFINGILEKTNSEKLIYVGHSQGSTQFLAHLSETDQSIAHKIQSFIALGPVISLKDVTDHPVLNLASKAPLLQFYSMLGFKSFLHIPQWLSRCTAVLMYNFKFYVNIFLHVVNVLCGYPESNKIDISRLGVVVAHEPGGASVNNLKHWIQQTKTNQFKKFNYGVKKNRVIYGSDEPPHYNFCNLKQYSFNKYIFRGTKDAVVSDNDFKLLISKLEPNTTFQYTILDYAHLDYIWGVCAKQVVYDQILSIVLKESCSNVQ